MLARTRAARAQLRTRSAQTRAAARIRRRGTGSLATHVIAAGIAPREARSIAGTLRKTAAKLGITGTEHRVHAGRRMRTTHRYTVADVAQMAVAYRPRKLAYKAARAYLLAA